MMSEDSDATTLEGTQSDVSDEEQGSPSVLCPHGRCDKNSSEPSSSKPTTTSTSISSGQNAHSNLEFLSHQQLKIIDQLTSKCSPHMVQELTKEALEIEAHLKNISEANRQERKRLSEAHVALSSGSQPPGGIAKEILRERVMALAGQQKTLLQCVVRQKRIGSEVALLVAKPLEALARLEQPQEACSTKPVGPVPAKACPLLPQGPGFPLTVPAPLATPLPPSNQPPSLYQPPPPQSPFQPLPPSHQLPPHQPPFPHPLLPPSHQSPPLQLPIPPSNQPPLPLPHQLPLPPSNQQPLLSSLPQNPISSNQPPLPSPSNQTPIPSSLPSSNQPPLLPSNLTEPVPLTSLIKCGLLLPNDDAISCNLLGCEFKASLFHDGRLKSQPDGKMFQTPHQWITSCWAILGHEKRCNKKQAYKAMFYKGVALTYYCEQYSLRQVSSYLSQKEILHSRQAPQQTDCNTAATAKNFTATSNPLYPMEVLLASGREVEVILLGDTSGTSLKLPADFWGTSDVDISSSMLLAIDKDLEW
ncbi:hypothetical protein EMCRGX_G027657 [Ephydatia muelleri]